VFLQQLICRTNSEAISAPTFFNNRVKSFQTTVDLTASGMSYRPGGKRDVEYQEIEIRQWQSLVVDAVDGDTQ
jgi:hypothetical protein